MRGGEARAIRAALEFGDERLVQRPGPDCRLAARIHLRRGGQIPAERRLGRAAGLQQRDRLRRVRGFPFGEQREHERLSAAEVVIERAARDAQASREAVGRHALRAFFVERGEARRDPVRSCRSCHENVQALYGPIVAAIVRPRSTLVAALAMHVLVVGAGIAGLAAAWQLKRGGCDVTVVEAAERAGGRIRSAPFHGHVIECGAQFPSSGYRHLMPLFGEAGLDAQLVKTSPWAAFEHRGRLFRVHARRPWTIPASGLLGWRDSVRVSRARAALLARVRALDPNRYAAFAEFDDADAAHWAERAFGRAAVDAIFAPMIHGLYFQPLRGASRALLAAVTGFDGADTLAVAGGWQTLPVALAARLDVRYGTRVDALSAHANGVDACVGDRALRFDAAIVATPATVARRLWRGQTDAQRALLATGYARCAHVAFGLAPGWRAPARLRRVYGALLSPHARRVAALTFERGRGIGDGQGEVVSAMLGHAGASALRYASDDEIARVALDDLRTLLPGVAEAVVATRVQRWDEAEPLSPVGRARAIAAYRASIDARPRVLLAGDYMGSPWTDGAAETGRWAARRLLDARA
ncbi:FAD binding domain protein [Burkholderia pseudomallei]|nr:FAD binding domain protein [Burkholderia pseudomallei]